jgi:hypothetical protein
MKSTFRLYNQVNSSFFNLIKGISEVQQTKGLALLLSKSDIFLNEFIYKLTDKKLEFDEVIVNSELQSGAKKDGGRIDILIRLFFNKKPIKSFLIEAKSAKINIEQDSVISQLNRYVDEGFPELEAFTKQDSLLLVSLTKYNTFSADNKYRFVTWSEIIDMLLKIKDKSKEQFLNELTLDYLKFLTNIKGTMKFYENEVLSIPTAKETNLLATEEPYIYECPDNAKYRINSKPLYVAFRKSGGGEMNKLFGVDDIIILNPSTDLDTFMNDDSYVKDVRDRVKKYCDVTNLKEVDDRKQFFILSETNIIELKHNPKPLKNNSYRAYYQLADILKNDVVGLKK